MEVMLAYLPLIDLAGFILAAVLIWQANRLEQQIRAHSKRVYATTPEGPQPVEESVRLTPE